MQKDLLKTETPTIGNTLLCAVKNGQLKRWFYMGIYLLQIIIYKVSFGKKALLQFNN
jgi:hypothetical protein